MTARSDAKLLTYASALISMGALAACGDGANTKLYDVENKGIVMPEPKLAAREKCYGISPAQQNSCATERLTDCAGTAEEDYLPEKWQYVAAGACQGLGGTMEPPQRPYKSGK